MEKKDPNDLKELREKWRRERFQRLEAKLQAKLGGKPLSNASKILGLTSSSVPLQFEATNVNQPVKASSFSANPMRRFKEPKIIPKETKLSLQRKMKLNPKFALQITPVRPSFSRYAIHQPVFRKVTINPRGSAISDTISIKSDPVASVFKEKPIIDNISRMSSVNNVHPRSFQMIKGLEKWLQKREKVDCKHLKKFLIQGKAVKKPKVIENLTTFRSTEQIEEPEDELPVLKEVLTDLFNIVSLGYPLEDSEEWLMEIYDKYSEISNEPLYWECLTLIKDMKGPNPNNDSFKENNPIHEQIEELGKKLKFINVNMTPKTPKPREPLSVLDQSNIFKSCELQFSIKEKVNKHDETGITEYFVTPVRRSTRSKLNTPCSSKSNQCVKSLYELTPEIRKQIEFKPNLALL